MWSVFFFAFVKDFAHLTLRVIADERSSLGERAKTIEYRFCEVRPHKARSMTRRGNEASQRSGTLLFTTYAPAEGNEKPPPRNQIVHP